MQWCARPDRVKSMYRYRLKLLPDPHGGFVVRVPALPEIVTQGETREEALAMAQDAIDEALADRIMSELDVPQSDAGTRGDFAGASSYLVLKVALYEAMRSQGLTKGKLARRLDVAETEVRRMLDPRHATKFQRIVDALEQLGANVRVEVDLHSAGSRAA